MGDAVERPTANVLAIDTTSQYLSLGLMKDGITVARHYENAGTGMNRTILTTIDGMLRGAQLTTEALHLIVAARGPGSFTGTRIGLALAKSIAQVRGLPLVGVDTLRLLAAQAAPGPGGLGTEPAGLGMEPAGLGTEPAGLNTQQGEVHAVLNCARGEVYHAHYRWDGVALRALGEIEMRTFAELPDIAGDTPVVLRRFPPEQPGHEAVLSRLRAAELRHGQPHAGLLLEQGLRLFAAGAPYAPAEPIYLKPEAFRKWKP